MIGQAHFDITIYSKLPLPYYTCINKMTLLSYMAQLCYIIVEKLL